MTVLRSREVKSVVKPPLSSNNSPNSRNTKQPRVSSVEPKTPVTRETQAVTASNSSSKMTDGSRSGSVRRSVRLASKNCHSSKSCDDGVRKSEGVSGGDKGSGEVSKKGNGKRKLGFEGGSVGEGEGDGGEGNGGRGDLKSRFDDEMERGSGKVERVETSEASRVEMSDSGNAAVRNGTDVQENDIGDHATRTRDRFRAQARRSASRFAFFSTAEEEQSHVIDEAEGEGIISAAQADH